MLFRYVGFSSELGVIDGRLEASTAAEAEQEVVQRGYRPISIRPAKRIPTIEEMLPSLFRIGQGDLVRFSRSMASMLQSGGSLVRALDMLEKESHNPVMQRVVSAIRARLNEGGGLSAALAEHPEVFSTLYISVVEVGEHTGRLATSLDQMADIIERESDAKKKALRSLMYPAAVMGLSMITLTFLMLVAMPPMLNVLDTMGAEVPFITRIVIGMFSLLTENFAQIIIAVVVFGVAITLLRRVPRIKYWLHVIQARAPLIGGVIVSGELSRFSRTVGMLLDAEVPLDTALRLGIGGCKNQVLRSAFVEAEEGLMSGQTLAVSMKRRPILPTMFTELITIGEESNSLQRTMGDAATTYQKQLDNRLNGLMAFLEPASTVFVGGIVGLMAFSMFMPIYSGLNAFR